MWNWKSWIWPGLVTTAAVSLLAIWFRADPVEAELTGRAQAALGGDKTFAQITFDGRDAMLSGTAPDEAAQAQAIRTVEGLRGVRIVKSAMTLLPVQSPYVFAAKKSDMGILLSGFAPGADERDALTRSIAAAYPGISVSGDVGLARGAKAGFQDRVAFGAKQLGLLGNGGFTISDDSLTITGEALSPADYLALVKNAEATDGVTLEVTPPPAAGPYGFTAKIDSGAVKLSGYVPALEMREKLAVDGYNVDDLAVATGIPDGVDWQAATSLALLTLSDLSTGTVGIVGDTLTISGEAKDGAAFQRLQTLTSGELSAGLALGTTDIGIPAANPYTWRAQRSADGIDLTGFVPSAQARESLLAQLRDSFGALTVKDQLALANGAPEGFEDAIKAAILALSRMDKGEVSLDGTAIAVNGESLGAGGQNAIQQLLASGLPDGFKGTGSVQLAPAPEDRPELQLDGPACQAAFNGLLANNTVLFETGQASVKPDSYGFLDQLAYNARRCPNVRLEVSGHTDSDGADEQNQTLSETRAKAVADYLAQNGVSGERLTAVGYGESRPVADNSTADGKAKNRRIEVEVLP